MSENVSSKSIHFLDCMKNFENTYEFLKKYNLCKTNEIVLTRLFCACLYDDYKNSHKSYKKKVLAYANSLVRKINIGEYFNNDFWIKKHQKEKILENTRAWFEETFSQYFLCSKNGR